MIGWIRLLNPSRWLLASALISLFFAEICPFLYPWILAQILDTPVASQGNSFILKWVTFYVVLSLFHSLFLFLRMWLGQRIGIQAAHQIRSLLFNRMRELPIGYFRKTPIGNTMSRMTSDVDSFSSIMGDGMLELLSNIILIVVASAFMLLSHWKLGLATLALFPALFLITNLYRKKFRQIQVQHRQTLASLTSFLQESLQGAPLLQVFRKLSRLRMQFKKINWQYRRISEKYAYQYAGFFPLVQSLSDLSLMICYAVGIYFLAHDAISLGTLVAFAWYASIYTRPLRDLSDRMTSLQTGLAAGERIREFLNEATPNLTLKAPLPFPHLTQLDVIDFHSVNFHYHEEKSVLQDFQLQIPIGTTLALAGATGCGKSTVLQLLLSLLNPQSGQISIGGVEINRISKEVLYQNMAWLGQEPFLFPGTLAENICLENQWNEDRLKDAILHAQLERWVSSLPKGSETQIMGKGIHPSIGQRQLISYARVLYQNPQILLLDEPSASIDAQTEHDLHMALQNILRDRTAILVSHRVASLATCDQVAFLREGRIWAKGTHLELQKTCPEYRLRFGLDFAN